MWNKPILWVLLFILAGCKVADYTDESKANQVKEIAKFARKHPLDFKQSESGLFYCIKNTSDTTHPALNDTVLVHYRGSLMNGKTFESTVGGQPTKIALSGAIPGWQEGILMMTKKGRATFIIPPFLAYGDKRVGTIPNDATLIFEIHLLDF